MMSSETKKWSKGAGTPEPSRSWAEEKQNLWDRKMYRSLTGDFWRLWSGRRTEAVRQRRMLEHWDVDR